MSEIRKRLLAKITVLVPVPVGSIKAKEQAKVAGIMISRGFNCAPKAMAAKMGMKIVAVAVLLLISVMKINNPITINSTKKPGNAPDIAKVAPSQLAKPVALKASPRPIHHPRTSLRPKVPF